MAEILKTPKSLILPDLENIKDPEVKRIFEEYKKAIDEFVIAVYSDISRFHDRIYDLENP